MPSKRRVTRYEYNGSAYYLTSFIQKDTSPSLSDSNGNYICSPWSGKSGGKNRECYEKIYKNLKEGVIIWEYKKKTGADESNTEQTPNKQLEPIR